MSIKGILFNTDEVSAILDGRKTVTRRVVKPQPKYCILSQTVLVSSEQQIQIVDGMINAANPVVTKPPYRPGDVLYVRETWAHPSVSEIANGADPNMYIYKADEPLIPAAWDRWRASANMPREAARIWLRVTDVRVERLQDITEDECKAEGIIASPDIPGVNYVSPAAYKFEMQCLWDSTIKPADRERYGWAANPWVWVIAFERCGRPEGK